MEKFLKEYGVIFILFLIMIFGVLALNSRMNTLSKIDSNAISIFEKGFTK